LFFFFFFFFYFSESKTNNIVRLFLYRSALRSFKRRVAYANVRYDRILVF